MAGLSKLYKQYFRESRGTTAIETAMLMPLVLMSVFALFHVTIFFFSTHQAQRASEQTGRDIRMLDQPSQEKIEAILKGELSNPMGGKYTPIVSKINENGETFADIRISYEYSLPIPFLDKHIFRSQSGTRVLLRDMS